MTTRLTLTYFDFHGGRGEPARIALHIGGVPFEDDRVKFPEFRARKPSLPWGAVPVLERGGEVVTQSNGINRYAGKLSGLYPEDPWQAALCDEVMDAMEDMNHKLAPTFTMSDEAEKKAAREALADGPIPTFLARLQTRLEAQGGQYFVEGRLTMADLKVFVWIRHMMSGMVDYVPADLAQTHAPLLVTHYETIKSDPRVLAYYAQFE